MAQPAAYNPTTAFSGYSAQQSWFPGPQLDVEFNSIKTSIGQIETNLALIQRDDGALANGVVTFSALELGLQQGGLAALTVWAPNINYSPIQVVISGTSLYQCALPHSSKNFAQDFAAQKWSFLLNLSILGDTVAAPSANQLLAGPTSGPTAAPTFRALVGADLPHPSSSTLGGIESIAAVTSNWINSISTSGVPTLARPAFSDVSGSVAAAQMPALTGDVTTSAGAVATTVVKLQGRAVSNAAPSDGNVLKWVAANSDWEPAASVGTGTVTSVAVGTGLTASPSPVTTTGTISIDPSYLRGYLAGCTLSNDGGTPNTVIDIAAGVCCSDDATTLMKIGAFTKTTAAWALGTGNGGLDTGSVASSTWYHVFIIERTDTGVVDALISTSASSPTMPTNYTKKRRIWSFKTDGSAHIPAFTQNGDECTLSVSISDVNDATLSTSSSLYTLSVPPGISVIARFRALIAHATAGTVAVISSPLESDQAVDAVVGMRSVENTVTNIAAPAHYHVLTNTSAQIRAISSRSSTTIQIATFGWSDRRGKDV